MAEEGAVGEAAEGRPEGVREELFHETQRGAAVCHQDREDDHGEARDEERPVDQQVEHVAELVHVVRRVVDVLEDTAHQEHDEVADTRAHYRPYT